MLDHYLREDRTYADQIWISEKHYTNKSVMDQKLAQVRSFEKRVRKNLAQWLFGVCSSATSPRTCWDRIEAARKKWQYGVETSPYKSVLDHKLAQVGSLHAAALAYENRKW